MTPTNSPEIAVLTDEQRERALYEAWLKRFPQKDFAGYSWDAWQARAALSTSREAGGEAGYTEDEIAAAGNDEDAAGDHTSLTPFDDFDVSKALT